MTVLSEKSRVNVGLWGVPAIIGVLALGGWTLRGYAGDIEVAKKTAESATETSSNLSIAVANMSTTQAVQSVNVSTQGKQIEELRDALERQGDRNERALAEILTEIRRK